jgi:hypothetical protein
MCIIIVCEMISSCYNHKNAVNLGTVVPCAGRRARQAAVSESLCEKLKLMLG